MRLANSHICMSGWPENLYGDRLIEMQVGNVKIYVMLPVM